MPIKFERMLQLSVLGLELVVMPSVHAKQTTDFSFRWCCIAHFCVSICYPHCKCRCNNTLCQSMKMTFCAAAASLVTQHINANIQCNVGVGRSPLQNAATCLCPLSRLLRAVLIGYGRQLVPPPKKKPDVPALEVVGCCTGLVYHCQRC